MSRKFLVRRTRDNMSVVFERRARRTGTHPLGNLEAISERTGKVSIRNNPETERRGFDFWEIRNVNFWQWWTRNWDTDRNLIAVDVVLADGIGGGHQVVVDKLNVILGHVIEEEEGDEGGSGLSSTGGTSVVSFRLENVKYALESAAGDTSVNYLRGETGDYFISEDLNTVIQRSDNTFLSVDTRAVDHGGGGGGGSAGNPVVSGAVSGNTMTLTLDDTSTVDIDVTNLVNGTSVTFPAPQYQYVNTGGVVGTYTHDTDNGPTYWGKQLRAGEELVWSTRAALPNKHIHIGKWNGGTSLTGETIHNKSNWEKKVRVWMVADSENIGAGSHAQAATGFDIGRDFDLDSSMSTLCLRYDKEDNKLKLYDLIFGRETIITTANVAEDGNPITIAVTAQEDDTDNSSGTLPPLTHRVYPWSLVAEASAGDIVDDDFRNGVAEDSVFKYSSRKLNKAEKATVTIPSGLAQNLYFSLDYTGSSSGQATVEDQQNAAIHIMDNGRLTNKTDFTINTKAQQYSHGLVTNDMGGRAISFRYNTDNSFDIFDETDQEVLFTKDTDLDGNGVNFYMLCAEAVSYANLPWNFTFEVNGNPSPVWYASEFNHITGQTINTGIQGHVQIVPYLPWEDTSFRNAGRMALPGDTEYVKFGQKIYPGQEIRWTQPSQTGSRHRHFGNGLGVWDGNNWEWRINFKYQAELDVGQGVNGVFVNGKLILNGTNGGGADAGDNIILDGTDGSGSNAGSNIQMETGTDYEMAGRDLRLVYEHGTNKMHLDEVAQGVRSRIVEGSTALDGNGKWLHGRGDDSYVMEQWGNPYYYDWTLVHHHVDNPKPWNNWRVNRPAVNNTTHAEDVWEMRDGYGPGQKFMYTIASSVGTQYSIGQWKASNAGSGISNVEQTQNFDWNVRMGNDEAFWSSLSTGFSFNPNNPNYDSTEGNWDDPKAGSGTGSRVSFRYHTDNSMDIFDEDQGIIIATKDADLDGNPVKLAVALNAGIATSAIGVQFPGSGQIMDIDLGQELSTGTKWYQQFSVPGDANSGLGPQLGNSTPVYTTGPFRWHKPLRAGEQIRWQHSGGQHIGIWSGTGPYTTTATTDRKYWDKVIDIDNAKINIGNQSINTKGFDLTADYNITQNSDEFILRYDSSDNKLKFFRKFADYELLIMQAISAEDGQPVIISAAKESSDNDGLASLTHELATSNNYRIDGAGTPLVTNKASFFQYHYTPGTVLSAPGPISATANNANNPYYYGKELRKGEQLEFTMNPGGNEVWLGIWGEGSSAYTPSNGGHNTYWSKAIVLADATDSDGTCIKHGTTPYVTHGFDLARDYDLSQGNSTVAIRYDANDSKLKVYNTTGDYEELICTANSAEDGNPVSISCTVSTGGTLPVISHQDSEWNILAEKSAGKQSNWRDSGTLIDTVLKHNRGIRPGFKYKTTTPTIWLAQFFSLDYTGSSVGQDNVENESASAIQVTSAEKLQLKTGWTINEQATRANNATETVSMADATISIRYHLDNSIDLYDEDNEQILMTKNADGDGNPVFLHFLSSTNVGVPYMFDTWTIEPFAKDWFAPATNYNGLSPGVALSTAGKTAWYNQQRARDQGGGSTTIDNLTRVRWAEPFYPGQEFVWTADDTNNMYMGDRTADDTAWNRAFAIEYASSTATVSHTNVTNFDVATYFGSGYNATGKTMSLRYDYGDKKLKLYDITTAGAETLVGQSTTAVAGGAPIHLTLGGAAAKLLTATHRYYGWEYVHTQHGSLSKTLQADNWRLNRPSNNTTLYAESVLKHLRGLAQGNQMKWTTAADVSGNPNVGVWKTSNATSGISDTSTNSYWDWRFQTGGDEDIDGPDLVGMTINTSNSNYVGGSDLEWVDPNPGTTEIGLRYHTNNTIDLYDFTGSEVIATVNNTQDGNPVYISFACNADITNIATNFFSGGDVTITSI